MNNSLIYLATTTVANVPEGGVLPLTTIVRRRGSCIQQSNNSIILNQAGYYHVSLNVTFTAPATGNVEISLLKDGEQIQGAVGSTTISTANTEIRSISYDAVVRIPCYTAPSILTIVNSGVAINTSNIAIDVEYLD